MNITFKYIKLHNFLSYQDARVNLQNRHYCLVSGVNNCITDNATSNGIGKSTIGSAICWALTGETIQGIKNEVKNINASDNECYVELNFNVDNDSYIITRCKSPKSDMKIILNNVDISGKGIKESEIILANHLPDLTLELLASTIILGQGLPQKFTSNTPSGRKEILEKLSKSDFMIQDLKNRIQVRQDQLNVEIRRCEDCLLKAKTQLEMLSMKLKTDEEKLEGLKANNDFDSQLQKFKSQIEDNQTHLVNHQKELAEIKSLYDASNLKLTALKDQKESELNIEKEDFNEFNRQYLERKYELQSHISTLKSRIEQIRNIQDVCPTCGQKIPNVVKPSTESDEIELNGKLEILNQLDNKYAQVKKSFEQVLIEISDKFDEKIKTLLEDCLKHDKKIDELQALIDITTNKISDLQIEQAKIQSDKENFNSLVQATLLEIESTQESLKQLNNEILYNSNEKDSISERLSIINQMNTLIKRDFRGFLLNDIIQFIDNRAKLYSKDIFKHEQIEFVLNGNNIDINFLNKPFESLSGGEQQRIDLIIQFSIRDMLQEYLNFSSNILFLDEIFDQLDSVAVEAVLSCILKHLCDIDSVFIISHRANELEIPYDTEICITKNSDGVSTLLDR